MLQAAEVHISALKEYIPCGHIHPHLQPGFQNSTVAGKNVQTHRLKMYMQIQATLEHAQVVNKLTHGRNNSV